MESWQLPSASGDALVCSPVVTSAVRACLLAGSIGVGSCQSASNTFGASSIIGPSGTHTLVAVIASLAVATGHRPLSAVAASQAVKLQVPNQTPDAHTEYHT